MTLDEFDAVVERRLSLIKEVLFVKGREYTRDDDRLSNFKNGALILRCIPERVLLGYMVKQIVSVVDYVRDLESGVVHSREEWDEKLGDCVNYLILLEAVLEEGRG